MVTLQLWMEHRRCSSRLKPPDGSRTMRHTMQLYPAHGVHSLQQCSQQSSQAAPGSLQTQSIVAHLQTRSATTHNCVVAVPSRGNLGHQPRTQHCRSLTNRCNKCNATVPCAVVTCYHSQTRTHYQRPKKAYPMCQERQECGPKESQTAALHQASNRLTLERRMS
jgi:hypothetical protein